VTPRDSVVFGSRLITKSLANGSLPALFKQWIGVDLPDMPDTGEGEKALPITMATY